jgi:amino acid permease
MLAFLPGIVTTFAMAIVTVHVLLACPVLVTTFSMDAERALKIDAPVDTTKQRLYRTLMRTLTMVIVALVAISIPYFSDFMTLIGSASNTMLIFVFPIIFHYKLFGRKHISVWENLARLCIVLIGILAGVVGGSQAVYALYMDFSNEKSV